MSALFIILVSLTMTLFSDKMLISHSCIGMWFDAELDQKILDGIYYILPCREEIFRFSKGCKNAKHICSSPLFQFPNDTIKSDRGGLIG